MDPGCEKTGIRADNAHGIGSNKRQVLLPADICNMSFKVFARFIGFAEA